MLKKILSKFRIMPEKIIITRVEEQEDNKDSYPYFTIPLPFLKLHKWLSFKTLQGIEYNVPTSYLHSLYKINLVYHPEGAGSHIVVSDSLIRSFTV